MTSPVTDDRSPHARVLLVDDDSICLEMLQGVVHALGYDVETAANGEEAFDRICEGDFRVVLSDWQMPRM